jgi:hypothetical protein
VWATVPLADAPDAPPLAERVAAIAAGGASGVLVDVADAPEGVLVADVAARFAQGLPVPWGIATDLPPLGTTDDDLDAWLRAGASLLGIASGADPVALAPLVDARERLLRSARERLDAERGSLEAWVWDAARRAPGGRALWLGSPGVALPPGFDWTVLDPGDASLGALPAEAFRLVIDIGGIDPDRLVRLVERGGIVAVEAAGTDGSGWRGAPGLRFQTLASTTDGRSRLVCRREDG